MLEQTKNKVLLVPNTPLGGKGRRGGRADSLWGVPRGVPHLLDHPEAIKNHQKTPKTRTPKPKNKVLLVPLIVPLEGREGKPPVQTFQEDPSLEY